MKRLILIIMMVIFMVSCEPRVNAKSSSSAKTNLESITTGYSMHIYQLEVDGRQFIIVTHPKGIGICKK